MERKIRSVDETRAVLEQRAAEHNAKSELAVLRRDRAGRALVQRPDFEELRPLIEDMLYAERMAVEGLWITSIIESGGNLLDAWDLVDEKRMGRAQESLDNSSS